MNKLWRNFLTGLFVIFPALVTVTILQVFFGWFFGLLVYPLSHLIARQFPPGSVHLVVQGATFVVVFFLITLIGFGTRIFVFKRLLRIFENLLLKIPLVGKIYGTIREIADAFGGDYKAAFSRVVLVEWPRKGHYVLGFVTSEGEGEVQRKTPEHVIHVFVPHAPNPTSGFLIIADRDVLVPLEMSVEEGMKLVVSVGMVGPEVKPKKISHGHS